MPAVVAAIVAALMTVLRVLLMAKIGAFIVSALLFFGFTFAVNNYAVQPAMDALTDYMNSMGSASSIAGTAIAWAGVLRFDAAVSVLISAYTVKWTIVSARVWLSNAV